MIGEHRTRSPATTHLPRRMPPATTYRPHHTPGRLEPVLDDSGFYVPGSLPSYDDLRHLTASGPDAAHFWSGRDASGMGVGPDGSGIAERIAVGFKRHNVGDDAQKERNQSTSGVEPP